MNLLLVEDDFSLAQGLRQALQHDGFAVNLVNNGKDAIGSIQTSPPDVVILDLGLPDIDGLDVLKAIRQKHKSLPVLILTARSSLDNRVTGLDSGADDYLAKPFEMPELLARMRVLGRRLGVAVTSRLEVGQVALDTAAHQAYNGNEAVELSRREYMLLKALLENAGKVQTRQALENKLYSWGEEVASNALEVHIHHLRKKFGTTFIKTIRGVGYTIKIP